MLCVGAAYLRLVLLFSRGIGSWCRDSCAGRVAGIGLVAFDLDDQVL